MANHHPVVVDSMVWKACVGSFSIPSIGETVYYFPEGHAEQLRSTPVFSPAVYDKPLILCRVTGVRFLANSVTDELFASIRLVPISGSDDGLKIEGAIENKVEERIETFSKKLTKSDANKRRGFTVPKLCAQLILPELNLDERNPVQFLSFKDVVGREWVFRHVYRGIPPRHLFSTGWSIFVDAKKLVSGDSIVFMKNTCTYQYYVGIRRVREIHSLVQDGDQEGGDDEGVISTELVVEAAELAAANKPFQVSYYPMAGRSEFVVNSKLVQKSCSFNWADGVRVKMAVQSDGSSSNMVWYQGTVTSPSMVQTPDLDLDLDLDLDPDPDYPNPWHVTSPWKMLWVEWDKQEGLENMNKRVSPWQVECKHYMPPTELFYASSSASFEKSGSKRRIKDVFPIGTRLLNNTVNVSVAAAIHYSIHARNYGMQGARQQDHRHLNDQIPISPNFMHHQPGLLLSSDSSLAPSTSNSHSGRSISLESQNNNNNDHNSESPPTVNESLEKDNVDNYSSFKLFGKNIYVKDPPSSTMD
ncbi:auxin response factor 8-like [Impatiens glandulifera]|uniref:auxin response factor 8-like n=1 Tax=Impatiens glandulifera TaxID=253017 RepID=UPI001FB140C7|nr:auxin response factor 8-like [Impatiens glandulifera]